MSDRDNDDGGRHDDERRSGVWLTEAQIEQIAERAKELALQQVYVEVGKSTLRAVMWIVGAALAALGAWLHLKP